MKQRATLPITVLLSIAAQLGRADPLPVSPGDAAPNSSQQQTPFTAAHANARRDEANPESRQWNIDSGSRLGGLLTPLLNPCMLRIAPIDVPTVTVVIRLDSKGKAVEVVVSDDSSYAKCVGERLQLLEMSSAPWENYWFEIVLGGYAKPGA
jgi:hypothetical protein